MGKTIVICLLLLAAVFLSVMIIHDSRVSTFFRWKRTTKKIVNYDAKMQSFVYQTILSTEQLFEKLRIPNIHDGMKYELCEDLRTITFMMEGNQRESCDLYIVPFENGCAICVQRTRPFSMSNVQDLPYLMNLFWINKVQAEPVDYYDWLRSRRAGNA